MRKLHSNIGLIMILIITYFNPAYAQINEQMEAANSTHLFIYQLKLAPEYNDPVKWTDSTYKVIRQHGEFLDSLGRVGTLIFAGRTVLNPGDKNLFGIAVIKASSPDVANKIMAKDPAVINNIQEASIFPFSMGIRYFENLKITKHARY